MQLSGYVQVSFVWAGVIFILGAAAITLLFYIIQQTILRKEYQKGSYYQVTHIPFSELSIDKGHSAEYRIYTTLKQYETEGARFLFNLYIPKNENETTEIDVILISRKGVFVFESKNYGGWIFGSDNQTNWYQTLFVGRGKSRKESFYNPILQNRNHIKHLKTFLGRDIPAWSIIVFSDRCTFKNLKITCRDASVIRHLDLISAVSSFYEQIPGSLLSENEIEELYTSLYPFTQTDPAVRAQHISNIQNNLNPNTLNQPFIPSPSVQQSPVSSPPPDTES